MPELWSLDPCRHGTTPETKSTVAAAASPFKPEQHEDCAAAILLKNPSTESKSESENWPTAHQNCVVMHGEVCFKKFSNFFF